MTGRRITSSGYVLVWAPKHPVAQSDGWALEHRMVWHDERGQIPCGHVIHHVDGDKQHNELCNLSCISRAEHALEHADEARPLLDAHRYIGTAALNAYNAAGSWNKGTAEWGLLTCSQCSQHFERAAHEAARMAARGNAPCCGRRCAAILGNARRAKATGSAI